MRSKFQTASVLVWLTQLGLSVILPLVLFIIGGVHLHEYAGWGSWAVVTGIVLGVLGAAGGMVNSFRTLHRLGSGENKTPIGFNDHD